MASVFSLRKICSSIIVVVVEQLLDKSHDLLVGNLVLGMKKRACFFQLFFKYCMLSVSNLHTIKLERNYKR